MHKIKLRGMDMKNVESQLQSGIINAMTTYATTVGKTYNTWAPYANQQGHGLNKIMADFIFTIDNCNLFMAEVKCLDVANNSLSAYDQKQYNLYVIFESKGFPVFYIYNNKTYLHNSLPISDPRVLNKGIQSIAYETLKDCNYSLPSKLGGNNPNINQHSDLSDFFNQSFSLGDKLNAFKIGVLMRTIGSSIMMNNRVLLSILGSNGHLITGMINSNTAAGICEAMTDVNTINVDKNVQSIVNDFLAGSNIAESFIRSLDKEILRSNNDKNKDDEH